MNPLVAEQRRRNQQSQAAWAHFAAHREKVIQLLEAAASLTHPGCLCVLGAGNCNDLDLQRILQVYARLDLVDLDAEALAAGIERQELAHSPCIDCRGNVDVSGVLPELSQLSSMSTALEVAAVVQAIDNAVPIDTSRRYQTVASVGLLSQVLELAIRQLGDRHIALVPLIQALRRQHLRLLAQLAEPGGTICLITEIVSSDSLPPLASWPHQEAAALSELLHRSVLSGNFFTGLNPAVLLHELTTVPPVSSLVTDARSTAPWLWDFGVRTYACIGFVARRRESA